MFPLPFPPQFSTSCLLKREFPFGLYECFLPGSIERFFIAASAPTYSFCKIWSTGVRVAGDA
jgi:hypothetical protein